MSDADETAPYGWTLDRVTSHGRIQPRLVATMHTIRRVDGKRFGDDWEWAAATDESDWSYADEDDRLQFIDKTETWIIETWQRVAVNTKTYYPEVIDDLDIGIQPDPTKFP